MVLFFRKKINFKLNREIIHLIVIKLKNLNKLNNMKIKMIEMMKMD